MLTHAMTLVRASRSSAMSGSADVTSELGKLTAATPIIAVTSTYRRCLASTRAVIPTNGPHYGTGTGEAVTSVGLIRSSRVAARAEGVRVAKFAAISLDDVESASSYAIDRKVSGVGWSKQISPADYSLFLVVSELDDGAVIKFDGAHGDEALCVLEGELDVDGRRCPTGGAVVVEAGVACRAVAIGPTRIAHYGPTDPTPPGDGMLGPATADGHAVHVVGVGGWFRAGNDTYSQTWWADSSCPTCRICVFRIEHPDGPDNDLPHHHTQDEIIFVLDGELRLGSYRCPAGTAISIPAHMRYSLRSDGKAFKFLNYRRDASRFAMPGREEVSELALDISGELVGDFR
jgi:quercetin dioxygenase-like cupin family protein